MRRFENNILLTQTGRLTMNVRPANPKYASKLEQVLAVRTALQDFKNSGGAITSKQWQKDKTGLQRNFKLYQWKMEQYKAELIRAY